MDEWADGYLFVGFCCLFDYCSQSDVGIFGGRQITLHLKIPSPAGSWALGA
jgi:hypothetical protein